MAQLKYVKFLVLLAAVLTVAPAQAHDDTDAKAALKRISYDTQFLASDELKGRGVGTEGIETAAKYIIEEYKKVGLKSGVENGSYRQPFEVNIGRQLIKDSVKVAFTGPQGTKLELESAKNCQPLAVGGDSALDGKELVFVGYGIKADTHNFDEFKNVDVKGKVVVLIRIEPQQQNEASVFAGKEHSEFARIGNKIKTTTDAGAVGIILVNDAVTAPSSEQDQLLAFDELGRTGTLPFVQIKRATLNEILAISPIANPNGGNFDSLAKIEEYIDANLEPVSAPIEDWTIHFDCKFESVSAKTDNIVGLLEGEGPLANEYVVIGGHYDHLGMGEVGSRAGGRREIHNGADDNATGTAAVLELARRYAKYEKKPKRTVVFICFSAEERGLLGAAHYCNKEPLFDLTKTVAMINYDMIGWLREGKLTIFGSASGSTFESAMDEAAKGTKIVLNKVASPNAGSDHMPFYGKGIPVMFVHTGLTDTYHTPEDDFNTLNMSGALEVIDFSEKMIWDLVNRDAKPEFVSADGSATRPSYAGVRFDFTDTTAGLAVLAVSPDSPALKAGLMEGDIVLEIVGKKISDRSEFVKILRDNKPGSKIAIKFRRGGEEKTIELELAKPLERAAGAPGSGG